MPVLAASLYSIAALPVSQRQALRCYMVRPMMRVDSRLIGGDVWLIETANAATIDAMSLYEVINLSNE